MLFAKLNDLSIGGKGSYGIAASAVERKADLPTYLRITDIFDDGTLNLSELKSVDAPNSDKYILKPNDIVFARTGGSTGRNYFYDGSDGVFVYAGFLIKFSIDPEKVNPKYVKYYCRSKQYNDWVQSFNTGSTRGNINAQIFGNMEIPLPERKQQDYLVSILEPIDEKIRNNKQVNDNLLAQAQTLYKQFFPYGVQDDLPDGWRIGTVGEIIEIHDSKRIPLSGADRTKMEKKIYPYYGAASLMDFVDNYIFDGKYLLLGEDGTVVDDAGYPILQYVWGQFWVNNHAHILTGRLGYDVESLYMLFKQTPVKSIVTGAVQPKISQANLRSVQVVIPPEHNLREYNDLVEPLFSLFRANEEECKTFTALRDMLLPKLMSGEIDVSAVQL
ncbi:MULTISPECIES: restriction endonuclease subunit S [Clostridia]|uniref:restriction endonuclease subunit S n=1 Tax=Clostridia TaxID=186801 RepID=UPI0012B0A747|nr:MULTISPECIES: restriction endonuclease subunit S [Oscillospiraceae]MCQ4864024.1 restriction endonuclease subunit S [Pseudoflavonifractor phocaeensis]MSD30706.1 restriction endonuclease subunit S [Faecalibacterium sp. BIOML-A4]MSD49248.1 restriction endonuclease subunit S [Faecalibacterium sp. BIOML-A3]